MTNNSSKPKTKQPKQQFPTLGEKLKYFRKRNNLSQMELEVATNSAAGAVSRIEKGVINPTKETILKIAEVLGLNDYEISYLIGKIAYPATTEEVQSARDAVKKYFNKKSTLAYMTDERSRLIDISKGFRLLIGLNEEKYENLIGQSFPIMLLRDEFGLKKFIDPEKLEKVLRDAFSRTYAEMGFMIGDPHREIVLEELRNHPSIHNHWLKLENQKNQIEMRTIDSLTVYLIYNNRKIKMAYHTEVLPSNPRFLILEYKPTNYLIKILQKFV